MDFALTDEQQLIRETARDFTDREIAYCTRRRDPVPSVFLEHGEVP